MEYENKFATNGKGNAALTLGIIGTGLAALGGGLNGVLGMGNGHCGCSEDHYINRYEASQSARIAELETEVKLRDANVFTLGEMDKMRNYFDAKFDCVERQLCDQRVVNAQVTANLSCMQGNINTLMSLTKTVVPIDNICPEPAVATASA